MTLATNHYPRFQKSSPSGYYQQISNFCVNYLEGVLVNLMHMSIPDHYKGAESEYIELQLKLKQRERTVRHAFQFQIEKNFSDFKSVRRTRLHTNRSTDLRSIGVAGQNSSKILDIIEKICAKNSERFGPRIQNQGIRLKSLVHSTDKVEDDNPVSPASLCRAFLASVETLNLTMLKTGKLFELFDYILDEQLNSFYTQIDLGMYYLDIFPELTDPDLFASTDPDVTQIEPEKDVVYDEPEEVITTAEILEAELEPEHDPQTESVYALNIEAIETHSSEKDEEPYATASNEVNGTLSEPEPETEPSQTPENKLSAFLETIELAPENNVFTNSLDSIYQNLKLNTHAGTLDYKLIFIEFETSIHDLVDEDLMIEIHKFFYFFCRLLDNALLSNELKKQFSRLSYALVCLVESEPYFFRSSTHPINDFIQSVVDFEIRSKHQEQSLTFIAGLFDELTAIDKPTLVNFLPIIKSYESYKEKNLEFISLDEWQQQQEYKKLEKEILEMVNQVTNKLVVETETLSFFYDDWQLLLIQIARKFGKDSNKFKQSLEIANVLAWSLSDKSHNQHPEYDRYSFAELIKTIDQGLKSLSYSPDHRIRVRKQLLKEFKLISQKPEITISGSRKTVISSRDNKFTGLFDNNSPQLTDFTSFSQNSSPRKKGLVEFTPEVGTWIVVKDAKTKSFKPARLNWKADDGSVYLFIDQRGHVIKECNQQKLDEEFSSGNIKLLKKKLAPAKKGSQLGSGFSHFE